MRASSQLSDWPALFITWSFGIQRPPPEMAELPPSMRVDVREVHEWIAGRVPGSLEARP